jgi:hypothetical protein
VTAQLARMVGALVCGHIGALRTHLLGEILLGRRRTFVKGGRKDTPSRQGLQGGRYTSFFLAKLLEGRKDLLASTKEKGRIIAIGAHFPRRTPLLSLR